MSYSFARKMKSRKAILLLIPALVVFSLTWALRDRLKSFVMREGIEPVSPRMIDGTIPSEDIRHSFEAANTRFAAEKSWRKRELGASEYPFTADEFMKYFEEISPEGVLSITCSFRAGDGQIISVTYPERLSEAIDFALLVLSRRTNNQANKPEMATPNQTSD